MGLIHGGTIQGVVEEVDRGGDIGVHTAGEGVDVTCFFVGRKGLATFVTQRIDRLQKHLKREWKTQ